MRVRSGHVAFVVIALFLAGSRALGAQPGSVSVSVSGSPGLLHITSAVAGSQPTPVSSSTTTYTVTTPNANRQYNITARLNAALPTGVTLYATFAAPPGATSLGPVALDATARVVVTNIPRRTDATQGITYELAADVTAGVVPNSNRTVTLTIAQAP